MKRINLMTTRYARPPTARLAAILLLGSLWLVSGCGSPGDSSSDQTPATDGAADGTESKLPGRVEIPLPDISEFDEAVQRQLRSKQSALTALRERAGVTGATLSQSYGEMGMLYHVYKLYDAAEVCYGNAQALAPRTFRWPYYRGMMHAKRGNSEVAIAAFKRALAVKADDVPALINLAQALQTANRPDEAQPFFERALAEDPACAIAHLGLGKIATLRREHRLAAQHFESALEIQPKATTVHYALAMAYRKLKQPDKAAEHLQKVGYTKRDVADPLRVSDPLMAALQTLPIGLRRHMHAAANAAKAGKLDVAVAELRKAVRANPDDPLARFNLGIVLSISGDHDDAIRQHRAAIGLRPKFAWAHRELAALLANKGDYEEAQTHYLEAVTCDPQLFEAHWGLAKLAMVTGKHELAVAHYGLAVEINPRHVEAREGHVVALTKLGRHADAFDSLKKSREVLPRSMTLAHAAARLWATCPEDSLRDGPKALELAKTVFRTLQCMEHTETVAMAFAETGDYDQARQWQNKALETATNENRDDAMPRLKNNLALYEIGKPCRTPW